MSNRIRIVDIAEELGLSTATVSNVIHGKTAKISEETVKRVQQKLDETGYIPNMAGILLAQNNSRIIGVVVNDNAKYEGRVLEDGFVMASLNALSKEVNQKGYFLMIKTTDSLEEVPKFASMWNMDGLILMGFCESDYQKLRDLTHISFVVFDGYFEKISEEISNAKKGKLQTRKIVNLVIDHRDGGFQAGQYFRTLGHKKALCLADNNICMDQERMEGFREAFIGEDTGLENETGMVQGEKREVYFWKIPMVTEERQAFYEEKFKQLKEEEITAVFAVSDYYAVDFMRFVQGKGLQIPEDIQVIGFDDSALSRECLPKLTTIHQDSYLRAKWAIEAIETMRDGKEIEGEITLPVELVERQTTARLVQGKCQKGKKNCSR